MMITKYGQCETVSTHMMTYSSKKKKKMMTFFFKTSNLDILVQKLSMKLKLSKIKAKEWMMDIVRTKNK